MVQSNYGGTNNAYKNLLPACTLGSRSISSLALRLEFSHLEVAVAVILANNYRKLQVGAMLCLGPLILGSDSLGGLLGLTSTTGADVYVSLGLALHRHRRKDGDGDMVSNKYDQCLREKGSWALKGCPAPAQAVLPEPTSSPDPALLAPTSPTPAPVAP